MQKAKQLTHSGVSPASARQSPGFQAAIVPQHTSHPHIKDELSMDPRSSMHMDHASPKGRG